MVDLIFGSILVWITKCTLLFVRKIIAKSYVCIFLVSLDEHIQSLSTQYQLSHCCPQPLAHLNQPIIYYRIISIFLMFLNRVLNPNVNHSPSMHRCRPFFSQHTFGLIEFCGIFSVCQMMLDNRCCSTLAPQHFAECRAGCLFCLKKK